jgi:hypothetical protein
MTKLKYQLTHDGQQGTARKCGQGSRVTPAAGVSGPRVHDPTLTSAAALLLGSNLALP